MQYIFWLYDQMILESNHQDRLAEILGKLITNAQSATHAVDEAAALQLGLNRTDLRCLGVLIEHGPLSASALAGDVGLSKGAMTIALDRLERAGFIRREHSSKDRRSIMVAPTQGAQKAITRLWGPIRTEGRQLLDQYGEKDLELLCHFFEDYIRLQQRHVERIRKLPSR